VAGARARGSQEGRGAGVSAWRTWRRGRPFWGGVFSILAGIEIIAIPLAPMPVTLHQGIGGVSSLLMGALMVVMGLVMWVQPYLHVIAGAATVLFALTSFVTSNLGGFGIGLLLGLLGGCLGLAWTPCRPESMSKPSEPTASPGGAVRDDPPHGRVEERSAAPGAAPPPAGHQQAGHQQAGGRRMMAVAALPVMMLAFGLTGQDGQAVGASPAAAPSPSATPAAGVERSASGRSSPSPNASPSAATPSPSPTGAEAPTPAGTPVETTPSGPAPTGSPTPSGKPAHPPAGQPSGKPASPTVCALTREDVPRDLPDPGSAAARRYAADLKPCLTLRAPLGAPVPSTAPGEPVAAVDQATLTADRMDMAAMRYDGTVTIPSRDGDVRAMKFRMDRLSMRNMRQTAPFLGHELTILNRAGDVVLEGDIVLHVTRLTGKLLGIIPVTFTPDHGPPKLPFPVPMMFTGVESVNAFVYADDLKLPELDLTTG
jgi:hypothetical protein